MSELSSDPLNCAALQVDEAATLELTSTMIAGRALCFALRYLFLRLLFVLVALPVLRRKYHFPSRIVQYE